MSNNGDTGSFRITNYGKLLVKIPVQIFKDTETGLFVASCKILNLITQGENLEEVSKNFEEVMEIFIEEYVNEPIKLKKYLEACGWELSSKKSMEDKISSLAISSISLVNSQLNMKNLKLPKNILASTYGA